MSGDYIPSAVIPVEIQENGVVRNVEGYIIGRLAGEWKYKEDVEPENHKHVIYDIDEMEHILNCFDNLFYINEQPQEVQKEWLGIIHKACSDARQKWCEAVREELKNE